MGSQYIGHAFGCLSLTLEMPFKDNADVPDPHVGWNGARSAALGAADAAADPALAAQLHLSSHAFHELRFLICIKDFIEASQ